MRHLARLVEQQPSIPDTTIHVLSGTFDDHMNAILDQINVQNVHLAPAFVMIDPLAPRAAP